MNFGEARYACGEKPAAAGDSRPKAPLLRSCAALGQEPAAMVFVVGFPTTPRVAPSPIPDSMSACYDAGIILGRASATPTLISTMPAMASASSVSPNISAAMTAVTAGTRKNSRATLAAAPWRNSQ